MSMTVIKKSTIQQKNGKFTWRLSTCSCMKSVHFQALMNTYKLVVVINIHEEDGSCEWAARILEIKNGTHRPLKEINLEEVQYHRR